MEGTDSDKSPSLLLYGINFSRKRFFSSIRLVQKFLKLLGRIKHYATIAHTTNKLTRLCSKSVLQAKVQPTREKHFPYAPHWGRLLALFTNTSLGWKGLQATNTPTYYED